jgi:CRISPR-associated protein (TIGR03984 family)
MPNQDYLMKDLSLTDKEVAEWLTSQAEPKERPFLLALADDGVIWGGFVGEQFKTSAGKEDISPELRGETLQRAFVFGLDEEIRLFRDEAGAWQARRITDAGLDVIVESQILWGSRAHTPQDGFTRIFDARQMGLDHIVPLEIENSRLDADEGGQECVRLEVHHLVDYNEDGEAHIALSRLAGLAVGRKEMEV